jgi:hypothetical protein
MGSVSGYSVFDEQAKPSDRAKRRIGKYFMEKRV